MGGRHPDAELALREAGDELWVAVDLAVAPWVERCVRRVAGAHGTPYDPGLAAATTEAGARARSAVGAELRALFEAEAGETRQSPLEVVRGAVRHPTAVLESAGVPPVARDDFATRNFPDDVYGLVPASFGQIDETLTEPALRWGAARAALHLAHHRGG